MSEEQKPQLPGDESKLGGVSIRGWLVVMMATTVCIMSPLKIQIVEPLYSGFLIGIGFYLGSKSK